jgi:hypothetical protein
MSLVSRAYKIGDRVIYRKSKKSDAPSPNAIDLQAEAFGESYRYSIKKYWAIAEIDGDRVQVITRRGKRHWLNHQDPLLRKANWCERLFRYEKFPMFDQNLTEKGNIIKKERDRT